MIDTGLGHGADDAAGGAAGNRTCRRAGSGRGEPTRCNHRAETGNGE